VGYDVEFIQVTVPANTHFPVAPDKARPLRRKASPFADPKKVQAALLKIEGCRPGPRQAVDYLGRPMSYARFSIKTDAIYVENDCNGKELVKIHEALADILPNLFNFDLQSQQLHDRSAIGGRKAKTGR
jgi:hypothetical protein